MSPCPDCVHLHVAQKPCPTCDGLLIELSSIDLLLCEHCKQYFKWELNEGQPSVLVEGKVGGRP